MFFSKDFGVKIREVESNGSTALDKYLTQQFYVTIRLLHLSEQTLLLVQGQLSHPQERKPLVQ